jgi:hypothetical protein
MKAMIAAMSFGDKIQLDFAIDKVLYWYIHGGQISRLLYVWKGPI